MAIHIEHDSPQTLHASKRLAVRELPRYLMLHGTLVDRPEVEARFLARLAALGFGVTDVGHGRTRVTPGAVDVDGMWRRARPWSRRSANRSHAVLAGEAARREAAIEEREASARVEAERAAIGEDLRDVVL